MRQSKNQYLTDCDDEQLDVPLVGLGDPLWQAQRGLHEVRLRVHVGVRGFLVPRLLPHRHAHKVLAPRAGYG
jgi:hypothetical protein